MVEEVRTRAAEVVEYLDSEMKIGRRVAEIDDIVDCGGSPGRGLQLSETKKPGRRKVAGPVIFHPMGHLRRWPILFAQ